MKFKKVIIIVLLIFFIASLIYFDYVNIITKLGLSVSLWSGFVTGVLPIALTIYLWKIEQIERIQQIKEESLFQKKLALRSTYIEYFETLLEQLNEYIIFLECYLLSEKTLAGKESDLDNKIESILTYIKVSSKSQIWKINYRIYAFKGIDIDIFKYNYNDEIVNLRAYMPYINMSNQLSFIHDEREFIVTLQGIGYIRIDEKRQKEIIKKIIESPDETQKLYNLLVYLKNDIEKKIAFD